jgi:Protein of unknown function (DUF3732)
MQVTTQKAKPVSSPPVVRESEPPVSKSLSEEHRPKSLQIMAIVIYNRDGDKRELHFRLGKVNIVTGASLTGKSALIKIVDYCLGRNEFIIPIGPISETVFWYVIHVKLASGEAIIGRPPPQGTQSTSAVYFQTGSNLQLPEVADIHVNSNTEALSEYLTEAVGITANENVPPEGQSREPLQASIKHARFLLFQPQGIIANEKHLFYRQDEDRIPQAIKDTLPYFLGATGDDQYERLQELRRLRRELRLVERRHADEEAMQGRENSRATALIAEAENVGLLLPGSAHDNIAEAVDTLRAISVWTPTEDDTPQGNTVALLHDEREAILESIRATQREIDAARSFVAAQNSFVVEATDQHNRLKSINLYPVELSGRCPVCDHELNGTVPKAEALLSSLSNLERQMAGTSRQRPRLEAFMIERDDLLADLRRRLRENKAAIDAVMAQDEAMQRDRTVALGRAKVVGRISLFIESVRLTDEDDGLRRQMRDLQARVSTLEEGLSEDVVDDRLNSILQVVGRDMSEWARRLELEHSEWPVGIDLNGRNPTVVAHRGTGPIRMFQMGGGKNWMGYHIVTHLALQKLFRERSRPVPGLLMLDQPTQVYYPPDRAADRSVDELGDEDQRAVKRLFSLIVEVTEQLAPNLQVIITDHADLNEPWFQEAVVAKWRGGEKLVPDQWIEFVPPPAPTAD